MSPPRESDFDSSHDDGVGGAKADGVSKKQEAKPPSALTLSRTLPFPLPCYQCVGIMLPVCTACTYNKCSALSVFMFSQP